MKFGVGFQSHIENTWRHALLAEQVGFDCAWLVDSQLLTSDVYACLTLAAHHTRRIQLATGITVAGTRIAPVIAHAIATVNQLAPGRTILGLGAGHTAWRSMGMPPVPIKAFRETVEVCQGLLRGQTVPFSLRGHAADIHFMDTTNGYINIDDPIPVVVAASHPRAQALAGELGDGVLSLSLLDPDLLAADLSGVARGWALREGGRPADYRVATIGISCVLHPGEATNSPRVLSRVGPRIAVSLHYAYEQARAGREVPPFVARFLTPEYVSYLDARWAEMHATHSRRLHPGEDRFITPEAIRALSLTGSRDEILERLHALEAAGLTEIVVSPPWGFVEESIVEFASEIVRHYRS